MNDATSTSLPSPFEKISSKFILDDIRDRKHARDTGSERSLVTPVEDTPEPPRHEVSPVQESMDATDTAQATPTLPPTSPVSARGELPNKTYFRIGEVSSLVGVEPHVLRYWESEFKSIRPIKTPAGHRVYSKKDVEILRRIEGLLRVERFSIQGAKRALAKQKQAPPQGSMTHSHNIQFLKQCASQLRTLIHQAKQW